MGTQEFWGLTTAPLLGALLLLRGAQDYLTGLLVVMCPRTLVCKPYGQTMWRYAYRKTQHHLWSVCALPNSAPQFMLIRLTVDDMVATIAAAREGIGTTRMAGFLGDSDPLLRRVPRLPDFEYSPICILTHSDLRNAPRIKGFIDLTARKIRKLQPKFLGKHDKTD